MGGLTFKQNWVYKNPAWLNDVIPTVTGVTVTEQTGGSLAAGTYCYRVVTKAFVSGVTTASSTASAEQCVTVAANAKVHVTWNADSHASSYRIYTGASGAQNQFYTVTAPDTTFDDTGVVGTAGTVPARGDFWPVKNNFELKQGDGASPQGAILIEGNIIDWSWCCAQNNIVSLKVNNQNTKDVSVTLRNLTFRNNWIRHGNRGIALTCTTTGNASPQSPSGPMENVSITNNLFTDLTDQYVGLSGTVGNSAVLVTTGSYANEVVSKGCIGVSFTHNTFLANANNLNGPVWLNINSTSDKFVDLVFRDNIMARDCSTSGCTSNGTNSLKGFAPNNLGEGTPGWTGTTTGSSAIDHNAWPDGTSGVYTAGPFTNSFFPTDADLKATHLANYTNCNNDSDITGCALVVGSSLHNAASDGTDIGANITTIKSFTDNALTGGATENPPGPPPNTGGSNDASPHGRGPKLKIRIR